MQSSNGHNSPDAHEVACLKPSHCAKPIPAAEAAVSEEVNVFVLENSVRTTPRLFLMR